MLAWAQILIAPGCLTAATFTVTSPADSPGATANDGTLRGAILAANADPDSTASEIVFNIPGGGTIALAANASGARMLPILRNPNGISINGANSGQGAIIVDGGSTSDTSGDRILFAGISADTANPPTLVVTPTATFSLANLTLRNGNARGGNGIRGGGGGAGFGGAVFVNAGTLALSNVTFEGNRAVGGGSSGSIGTSQGGGGGGMGGNVSLPTTYATGGGGFGLGSDAPDQAAGLSGVFAGGLTAGNGAGTGAFAGGAMAGGGGAASSNGGAGGGGFGGTLGTATSNGSGGFGGGGAGATSGVSNVAGSGGFGGGGGGSIFANNTITKAGFGGGGAARSGTGGAGFGGGIATTSAPVGAAGGGAGFGGAVFVRQGARLTLGDGVAFSQNRSLGGIGANSTRVSNQGLGLAPSVFLDAASVTGVVSLEGNSSLNAETHLAVAIGGTTAGSTHGQLKVTGTITLANTRIVLTGAHVPVAGQSFTLVDNDGADPIAGTFYGLPEGAVIPLNGVQLVASYVGGDGNDFTLTAPASPLANPTMQVEYPAGTPVTSLNFGTATVGVPVSRTLTVKNTSSAGAYPLSVLDYLKIGGSRADDFILDTTLTAAQIAPGASTTVKVLFQPRSTLLGENSSCSTTLRFSNNSVSAPGFDLALSGTAPTLPKLVVEQSAGTSLISGLSIADFGVANAIIPNVPKTFVLKNMGSATLAFGSIHAGPLTSPFLVQGAPSSLAPGASANLVVTLTYSPSYDSNTLGYNKILLTIPSNDPELSEFRINLTGSSGDPLIDQWKQSQFGAATENTGDSADYDGDGVNNLLEFAFGSNASSSQSGAGALLYTPNAGIISVPVSSLGSPVIMPANSGSGTVLQAFYVEKFQPGFAGLTYTPQFSSDLTTWVDAVDTPQSWASSEGFGYQIQSVPYPATVNGQPTLGFRVKVSLDPNVR